MTNELTTSSGRRMTATPLERCRSMHAGTASIRERVARRGSPPEPAARHAAPMNPIHLRTVADLIARQHTLGLYCHHCDRWSEAPLEQLARDGWGRTPIVKLRFRCAICDGPAQR